MSSNRNPSEPHPFAYQLLGSDEWRDMQRAEKPTESWRKYPREMRPVYCECLPPDAPADLTQEEIENNECRICGARIAP